MTDEPSRYAVDRMNQPADFPTHKHSAEFWEALGRTVATFGFLEEILGEALFSFTATRKIPEDELEAEYEKWLPTLQRALNDTLGALVNSYGKAVRDHDGAAVENLDELLGNLREASTLRNVLCHGSWRAPDDQGRSIPLYVDSSNRMFQDAIDVAYLQRVQQHTAELVCAVMNTVAQMGWQFPGSTGPEKPIMEP